MVAVTGGKNEAPLVRKMKWRREKGDANKVRRKMNLEGLWLRSTAIKIKILNHMLKNGPKLNSATILASINQQIHVYTRTNVCVEYLTMEMLAPKV
jgi:hypothetical protein